MKFTSGKEMLDYITGDNDLYNQEKELYVFHYNDKDSICTYPITVDETNELAKGDEYWGAYLGRGGNIYDNPQNISWCEAHYLFDGWVNTKEYRVEK